MAVLDKAVAWWSAAKFSAQAVKTSLEDSSGNGHDAQFGSAGGADTNDPLFLEPDNWASADDPGTQFLFLPGAASNCAAAPDSAALSITGDLDLRARIQMDDWTPSNNSAILAKWGTGSEKQFIFRVLTSGALELFWSTNGSAQANIGSSVVTGFTNGTTRWVRVTADVDNGAADADIKFWDGGTGVVPVWVQLGTTRNPGSTISFFDGAEPLTIGNLAVAGTNYLAGKVYEAQVLDGIDGTVVFDADFTNRTVVTSPYSSFTEESAQAATVTIHSSGVERHAAIIERPQFMLGADNYFLVADHANLDFALADDFTIAAVYRPAVNPHATADGFLISKGDPVSGTGYGLWHEATTGPPVAAIRDGTNAVTDQHGTNVVAGQLHTIVGVRDAAGDDDLQVYLDGVASGSPTTDSTTATLANAVDLILGAGSAGAAGWADGLFAGWAVFDSVLSDAEIARLQDELLGVSGRTRAVNVCLNLCLNLTVNWPY
jgi:hypothetical protein